MKIKNTFLLFLFTLILTTSCGATTETPHTEEISESYDLTSYNVKNELSSLIDYNNAVSVETDFILVRNEGNNLDISIGLVYHGQDAVLQEFSSIRNIVENYINENDYKISKFNIATTTTSEGIISWTSNDLKSGSYLNSLTDEFLSSYSLPDSTNEIASKSEEIEVESNPSTESISASDSAETLSQNTSTINADTSTNHTSASKSDISNNYDTITEQSIDSPIQSDKGSSSFENGANTASEFVNESPNSSENNFDTYDNKEQQNTEQQYVLNTETKKIHLPSCRTVPKIAPENYATTNSDIDSLKSQGYDACGICLK